MECLASTTAVIECSKLHDGLQPKAGIDSSTCALQQLWLLMSIWRTIDNCHQATRTKTGVSRKTSSDEQQTVWVEGGIRLSRHE